MGKYIAKRLHLRCYACCPVTLWMLCSINCKVKDPMM